MFGRIPQIHIHEWKPSAEVEWLEVTSRAHKIETAVGQGSLFEATLQLIKGLLMDGKEEDVRRLLDKRRNIRALLTLWQDQEGLAKQSMSVSFMRALREPEVWPPTRMSIGLLIGLHLSHFDFLDEWQPGLFNESRDLIRDALKVLSSNTRSMGLVEAVRQEPDNFLLISSPESLANVLIDNEQTLAEYLERTGIHGFDAGRFGDLVRNWYYLEQIRQADPKLNHSFLGELTSQSVSKAPAPDGRYFGHHVIEAMTNKPSSEPTRSWIDTIVDIAGDPRLSESEQWHTWWRGVTQESREQMIRWLSAEDLRLFLAAVELYGQRSENDRLERMFPARRKFIEGLHSQGIIRETRLILGNKASSAIRQHLGTALRTDIALLEKLHDTSIIYIDCGDFKIIEGSHDYKMWIFIGGELPLITNRKKQQYTANELREDIPEQHGIDQSFGAYAHMGIVHNGFWQRKALEFIAEWNISIDAEKVLTKEDYSDLRRSGLPVPYHRYSLRK